MTEAMTTTTLKDKIDGVMIMWTFIADYEERHKDNVPEPFIPPSELQSSDVIESSSPGVDETIVEAEIHASDDYGQQVGQQVGLINSRTVPSRIF